MVLTSIPVARATAAEILAVYCIRWQIELAFKRLKSSLGMDRLLARDPAMAQSWLLTHLILALMIEDAAGEILDSPPVRQTCRSHPMSLWRLHVALKTIILGVILRPPTLLDLKHATRSLIRHICDPPRARPSQSASARDQLHIAR